MARPEAVAETLRTQHYDLLARELNTLFEVSKLLSDSLEFSETAGEVLQLLHEEGPLRYGMISLVDEPSEELKILALHSRDRSSMSHVRYLNGEGIVGSILAEGRTISIVRLKDDPRFQDKLNIYNPDAPFIAVPLFLGGEKPVGVMAGQPGNTGEFLEQQTRFIEMVANLIDQAIRLARLVESKNRELQEERDTLRREVKKQHGLEKIIGRTEAMRLIFEQVRMVSKWNTTVLIRGESGTGKELIANAIHYNSPRASENFIKLNCAALPDNLLETELFGHEKGAFTGATTQHKGRFEQADGGTLFLDEIGEISGTFQSKLLRVLQEGEFERVGGTKTIKVDVRIIAATNRNLEAEVEQGNFREDLYYRLNVMPLQMPALRERMEDVPELARFLVAKIAHGQGRALEITNSAIRLMMRHNWPGNVRELENRLERAAVMSMDGTIDRDIIGKTGIQDKAPSAPAAPISQSAANDSTPDWDNPELDERERVIAALEEAGWVQAKAARLLGLTPRQIAYRIQTLKISVRRI